MIAPPAMAVDKYPDALVVYFPTPFTAREKITANITELNNPTPIIDQTATLPPVLSEIAINPIAAIPQKVSTFEGLR